MVTRHAFTVDEWHRLAEVGLFVNDSRVELFDGEIIELEPITPRHAVCVNRINRALILTVGDQAVVRVRNPVILGDRSEPHPDLSLVRPPLDRYLDGHPTPADAFLLIEVADSSLTYDRDTKASAYGRAGVTQTWVVDLDREVVLVFSRPGPDGYQDRREVGRGSQLEVTALPGITVAVDYILGPPAT